MPQFEIRCNTERVLNVEAADEASALQIAEDTDYSDWDSAESPYSIEPLDATLEEDGTPDNTAPPPVQKVKSDSDALRIDTELFRVQRELLTKIVDLARKNQPYTPAAGDEQLLDGLLELTDALFDSTETGNR
jgi:hypothetical protein